MEYVLILGAGSDIARAVARRYAKAGYGIYMALRRPEEAAPDVNDFKIRYGIDVKALPFDATDFASHERFYAGLDPKPVGVVCAVGYMGDQEKSQTDFSETKKVIETNYAGPVSIINVIASDFEKRGGGFIIGVSSVAGDRGRASNYTYGSAKAGFTAYLSGLRNRLHKSGVHVMTVKPGFVLTRMTEKMDLPQKLVATADEAADDIYRGQAKKRDVVYTKWFWRFIMLVIMHIPEKIFKRLKLQG